MSLKDYRTTLVLTLGAASVSPTSFSPIFHSYQKELIYAKLDFLCGNREKRGINSSNNL